MFGLLCIILLLLQLCFGMLDVVETGIVMYMVWCLHRLVHVVQRTEVWVHHQLRHRRQ